MPLAFDTTIPVATPERRAELIDAIIAAADEYGETHWLEWKSACDLGAKAGVFELAKEILALSNRDVSTAQADCGGFGYLVVGVSESGLHGAPAFSATEIQQKLAPFLGTGLEAPAWTAHHVVMGEKTVLVIEVAPPTDGDPLRVLQRNFEKAPAGTVYVRDGEIASPATPDQMRMLQARFLAGRFDDLVTERLALACTTLNAELECRPKAGPWHPTARIRPRTYAGEWPEEILVMTAPQGSFERAVPDAHLLSPLQAAGMIIVFPEGTDLLHASQETQAFLQDQGIRLADNHMGPGKPIALSGAGFAQLHQSVQWLLIAASQNGQLPMSIGFHCLQLSGPNDQS